MPAPAYSKHDIQAAINAAENAIDPIKSDDKMVTIRNRDLKMLVHIARDRPEDKTEEFRTAIHEAMDTLRNALA